MSPLSFLEALAYCCTDSFLRASLCKGLTSTCKKPIFSQSTLIKLFRVRDWPWGAIRVFPGGVSKELLSSQGTISIERRLGLGGDLLGTFSFVSARILESVSPESPESESASHLKMSLAVSSGNPSSGKYFDFWMLRRAWIPIIPCCALVGGKSDVWVRVSSRRDYICGPRPVG